MNTNDGAKDYSSLEIFQMRLDPFEVVTKTISQIFHFVAIIGVQILGIGASKAFCST